MITEDAELLRRYALEGSQDAIGELIRRHVDLVYSAALRLVNGDAHRAHDVTQQVFVELARQAKRLLGHPAPVGWLYTTTRFVALRAVRAEQRRHAREQEANIMNELLREPGPEPDWMVLGPVLEQAMHELGEQDRLAVLLRYFQNQSLKDVGLALGLNENAARMRVERALEKLRSAFAKRGIATTSALAATLAANAVQLAPPGLAATLTAAAGATATTGAFTLLKIMTATQLKIGLSALVVAGAVTALVIQRQTQEELRAANEALAQQLAKLKSDNESLSNRLAFAGDAQRLSADQLDELLKLRGESRLLKSQLAAAKAQTQAAAGATPPPPAADAAKLQTQAEMRKLKNAKYLVAAAMFGFSEHHGEQFPTNWEQTTSYFDQWERSGLVPGDVMPDTLADFNALTNQFELAYQGATSNLYGATNFGDIIVVREKQPWQSPDGKWLKIYGFADGHSEIHAEPAEGFDAYEQNHELLPPSQ